MNSSGRIIILKYIELLILLVFPSFIFSQAQFKKHLIKAVQQTEKGNLEKSRAIYLSALEKDKDNYKLNVSLGITLADFMERPEEALPYLENAYKHTPKDTLADLIYALGKCYLHAEKYEIAETFFEKLKSSEALTENDFEYQKDLKKHKEDCKYALNKDFRAKANKQGYVINLGPKINTDMPEYVPVITRNKDLIFTSKRKDTKREQLSEWDGKYFESMYIAHMGPGTFESPRRYTVPDLFNKSHFSTHHESIISISPDGKILFVFRDNKIFEVNVNDVPIKSPDKLSKTINFTSYHNHAYLSKDEKTLYFTSEGKGGLGGIDIYKAEKTADGNWGLPQNLGAPINTEYDEDAPFLTDDGKTLYFASKGHPGYGNFDIYKSELKDGKWSEPENLGQPINSPAHDIFLVMDSTEEIGYFSSSRKGGFGDMDIYRVNFLKNMKDKDCITSNDKNITFKISKTSDSSGTVSATLPDYFKVQGCIWKINNKQVDNISNEVHYNFDSSGTYPIEVKIVSACDSCLQPMVACSATLISMENIKSKLPDLTNTHGELTKEESESMGFDLSSIHFNFDRTTIRQDAIEIIAKNLKLLKAHPELSIILVGHTDCRGGNDYNNFLSMQRAGQAKAYLLSQGLSESRIVQIEGKGEDALINNCKDDISCDNAKHEENRRVEFIISKK